MASGTDKGEQNLKAFLTWRASKTDDDYRQMIHRGSLSRKEIAAECGFGKSALAQNPAIRAALKDLEDDLRKRSVLPSLVSAKTPPLEHDYRSKKVAQTEQRLKRMEQENAALKAEVKELKEALKHYALLEEVMSETGRVLR